MRRRGFFARGVPVALGALGAVLGRAPGNPAPFPSGPPNVLTLGQGGSGYAVSRLVSEARGGYGPVWETVYATTGTIRTGWEAR